MEQGDDVIDGGKGRDDIYGGHHVRHGHDGSDSVEGNDGADVVLGDNGQILRNLTNVTTTDPWLLGMVWEEYPAPFQDEVHHDIKRYDDIDYISGDDTIRGGSGNDILLGQRGDDKIFGDGGEDELYGGLGFDTLHGGEGNDILIGDVGYATRRFENGKPVLNTKNDTTNSTNVWHKDIVLEEVGNITGVNRISEHVDTNTFFAENLTQCSFWMVATEVTATGAKPANSGENWTTDLLCFEVFENYDDYLDGGAGDDVLFGQRGDDTLNGSDGDDILVGDAGSNFITTNTDIPRVYPVYRMLHAPSGSTYSLANAPDYGQVFTADYELYPSQYRVVDNMASVIDSIVNLDDLKTNSSLVHDVIGVSALPTNDGSNMQPIFRMTPGFLEPTQHVHGSDTINPGSGYNLVAGDDIRGYTGLDLTDYSAIQRSRQRMDSLILDLSIRMSTLEVDTEVFMTNGAAVGDLVVASDTINTDTSGTSLVTGDSLTLMGRVVLGDSLNTSSITGDILERHYDVEQGKIFDPFEIEYGRAL